MTGPQIFNLQRFALDDGPGIRTTVYCKGCPLGCVWCHNPESISPAPELMLQRQDCLKCGDCQLSCSQGAINNGVLDRALCSGCGDCVEVCPTGVLQLAGRKFTVDELLGELIKDVEFYRTSGGGVTFSGGEPTMFPEYIGEVARQLRQRGIHVALQTCGHFELNTFRKFLLPHLDLLFFDLKLIDSEQQRLRTGRDNRLILENYHELLATEDIRVIVRTPLIPGLTATAENLAGLADLVRQSGCEDYQLLPYNPSVHQKLKTLKVVNGADLLAEKHEYEERYWRKYVQERMA